MLTAWSISCCRHSGIQTSKSSPVACNEGLPEHCGLKGHGRIFLCVTPVCTNSHMKIRMATTVHGHILIKLPAINSILLHHI